MAIKVLSSEIANMIAAGEVVERPASVVKELTENCIDAGATSVTIEIKKGGIQYIRVTDDGCGIERQYAKTAFLRHATSKITDASDLDSIATLGFRGEALASIAAVARVELFTKTADSHTGTLVTVEGGEVLDCDDAGCPDGTTIIVRNLFFNTPARMKFLKSDSTETGYITDVVNKLVLSHPEIAFKYINNGKTVLSSSGDGKLLGSIYTVFGRDYANNMTEVCYEDGGFRVTGYVGNSRLARKDRRHQMFFVNSRNIMSRIMSGAVSEAYKNTVMTGRYPVCVLKAEVDPKYVDVNVHPAKTEVRFADEKQVYGAVYWAVKNALTDKKYVPEIEINKKKETPTFDKVKNAPSYEESKQINLLKDSYVEALPQSKRATKPVEKVSDKPVYEEKVIFAQTKAVEMPFYSSPRDLQKDDEDLSRFAHVPKDKPSVVERKIEQDITHITVIDDKEPEPEPVKSYKADIDFKLIGQVFGTYILVQMDNEMLVIDQHAAHERIYFEELLADFKANEVAPQMLLLPVTMTLTASELETAQKSADFFEQLGFGVEVFGRNSIIVRYTPGTMEEQDIKDLISDMLTLVSKNTNNIAKAIYEEALHMIACKRALKGNKALTGEEMKTLAERVLSLGEGINTCPHGRPIMIKMTKYSLEKQFKRVL